MVAKTPVRQLEGVAGASALEAGTRDEHGYAIRRHARLAPVSQGCFKPLPKHARLARVSQGRCKPLPKQIARLSPPLTGRRKLLGRFLDVFRALGASLAQGMESSLRIGDVRHAWRLVCRGYRQREINHRPAQPHGQRVRSRSCEQRATRQTEPAKRNGHEAR